MLNDTLGVAFRRHYPGFRPANDDEGVSMSSAETYPAIAEAMTAAALKLLDMRERLEALDTPADVKGAMKS